MTAEVERSRAVARVLWATLALNLVVAGSKIAYGFHAHALSIRADGFHSLTDSTNNLIGLVALWIAVRPPDRGHPYGHHKFELLAAALVGVSLIAMAIDVVRSAFERLAGGSSETPDIGGAAFAVLLGTLCVNVLVAGVEWREGRRLQSSFLMSDATHTGADVAVTLGVLVATLLVRRGWLIADVVAALAVASFVAWAGVSVLRKNLSSLADAAQVDAKRIEALAVAVPHVASAHKIRSRGSPTAKFVDLHIQITPELDVVEAHRVTHQVIDTIKANVSGVTDVLVHTEPAGDPDDRGT